MNRLFFQSSGGKISYLHRPGTKKLILIHGFTASSEIWEEVVKILDPSFEIICIDLFGHGESPIPDMHASPGGIGDMIKFQCKAIVELMDHLGIHEYFLAGSSMGGWISMELSLYRKPEKAILIDPAGVVPISDGRFAEGLGNLFTEFTRENENYSKILYEMVQSSKPEDFQISQDAIDRIDFPVFILWGEEDYILDPEFGKEFSKRIKDCRFELIKGGEHVPFRSHPKKVSDLMNQFLLNP